MKKRRYSLNDFDERHIDKAREYVKTALWGHMTVCLEAKVDEFIDLMRKHSFEGNDRFTLNFAIETVGNDILTAIGCSINAEKEHDGRS